MAQRDASKGATPAPDAENPVVAQPPTPSYQALLPHPTPSERASRGKALRQATPRSSQAMWEPWPKRPDPITLLERQASTRWDELVPIRHGRMLASPFAFFRGGALIMATDLSTTPRTGIHTQTCGDAHISNFGVFSAPDRALVFDINDFDETLPGPWEWDLKRLAASFEVAMRERGAAEPDRRAAVIAGVRRYRQAMSEFAQMSNLDVWYARLDTSTLMRDLESAVRSKDAKRLAAGLEKAQHKDSVRALDKLTHIVDGEPRIVSRPPLVVPASELLEGDALARFTQTIHEFLKSYAASLPDDRRHLIESYEFKEIARKVVGVGSVGLRSWIVFTQGRDGADPLFLQLKQAESSVLERFVGRSRYRNHGHRVVEGQRLMQASSDILLGWYKVLAFDGKVHDFYVRQLWDGKASPDPAVMPLSIFPIYAETCGWTLARAHARSGDRIAISAYLGASDVFDNAVADFARAYADQNERDFGLMQAAVKSGRLQAETGV